MASETKLKKRKNSEQAAPPPKKAKPSRSSRHAAKPKDENNNVGPKSERSTSSKKSSNDAPPQTKTKRKRAVDFIDADAQDDQVDVRIEEEGSKKAKKDGSAVEADDVGTVTSSKELKKRKLGSMNGTPAVKHKTEHVDDWELSEEDDIGDQSAALLQGFESSSDEEEGSDGDEAEGLSEVPAIPANQELAKKLQAASATEDEAPGVIYVGRIPHGFYEHQMRAYFSQFGDITRLRLSRNQKTGHSKHYAFVEFASTEVAKIVAATMNKYLLFGHILQIRMLAPEEVHKDLFKNANKRFKVVPRNKISGRRLRLPMERDHWEKRIEEETKRRKAKEEKLMALGYDFKMPGLKTTKSIPFRSSATKQLEAASVDMEEMLKELPEVPDVDVERDMSLPSTSTKGTPKEPGSKPAKVKKGKVKSVKSKASA